MSLSNHPTQIISISLTLLLLTLLSRPALADKTLPPKELLEAVARDMITSLNNQREELSGDAKKVRKLVEEKLLPHTDAVNSSRQVLDEYWGKVSKAQKKQFIKEFRTLLLRFYSSALAEYLDDNREPLDTGIIRFNEVKQYEGRQDITVYSEIRPKKSRPVAVLYHMLPNTKRGWRVYDVSVEGASVINTYKPGFVTKIKDQGIDKLINWLAERNETLRKHADEKNPFASE